MSVGDPAAKRQLPFGFFPSSSSLPFVSAVGVCVCAEWVNGGKDQHGEPGLPAVAGRQSGRSPLCRCEEVCRVCFGQEEHQGSGHSTHLS